jgi:hypothetical protein
VRPFSTTEAAVSSQEVSIPSIFISRIIAIQGTRYKKQETRNKRQGTRYNNQTKFEYDVTQLQLDSRHSP